jgi:hypothetical protein
MSGTHPGLIWALWTAATAIGYSLGLVAGFFLAHFVIGPAMVAVAIGCGVGLLQRPIAQGWLEPRRSRMWSAWDSARWVLASVGGTTIAAVVATWIGDTLLVGEGWTVLTVLAAAFGLGGWFTGWVQERVLRRYTLRSRRWVGGAALAWGVSACGLGLIRVLERWMYPGLAIACGPAVSGFVLGAITGAVLVRLPRRARAAP